MEFDFKEIATVGMVLFAVIDIVGTIPIIVDLRTNGSVNHSVPILISKLTSV